VVLFARGGRGILAGGGVGYGGNHVGGGHRSGDAG
jgi:hypothetical protein